MCGGVEQTVLFIVHYIVPMFYTSPISYFLFSISAYSIIQCSGSCEDPVLCWFLAESGRALPTEAMADR